MGNILGNGPEIFTFEELHFFDHLLSSASPSSILSEKEAQTLAARLLSIQASDWLTPQDPNFFSEEATKIALKNEPKSLASSELFENFLRFTAKKNGKKIPCEQTPQNVFHIQDLLTLYPESFIINMVRDPRDVLLSQKYKWKIRFLGASNIPLSEALRSWSNYHSAVISKLWNSSIQAAAQFQEDPRVKTVRFEDLVQDPELVIKDVCEFAKVRFDAEMMNISQGEGGVSSHKKVSSSARGIDAGVVSRWEKGGLLVSEVHICQAITKKNMRKYGYEPAVVNTFNKLLSVLLFIF
ncbi:MAG: sulfotransferase, partial [Cyanobacteria bacterium J06650_10]